MHLPSSFFLKKQTKDEEKRERKHTNYSERNRKARIFFHFLIFFLKELIGHDNPMGEIRFIISTLERDSHGYGSMTVPVQQGNFFSFFSFLLSFLSLVFLAFLFFLLFFLFFAHVQRGDFLPFLLFPFLLSFPFSYFLPFFSFCFLFFFLPLFLISTRACKTSSFIWIPHL